MTAREQKLRELAEELEERLRVARGELNQVRASFAWASKLLRVDPGPRCGAFVDFAGVRYVCGRPLGHAPEGCHDGVERVQHLARMAEGNLSWFEGWTPARRPYVAPCLSDFGTLMPATTPAAADASAESPPSAKSPPAEPPADDRT